MHITALVKSRDHVCCRYRMAAFRAHFERLGCEFELRPWSSAWFLQLLFAPVLRSIDTLIVQRKLFPAWQLKLLRRRVQTLIYDFDDSVFHHNSYREAGADCPKRQKQFEKMMQTADAVVAGNEFLRDHALASTAASKVHVIPTCVDVNRYSLASHDEDRPHVKLAWIGSASTLRGLERIRGMLDQLGAALPNLQLRVICDRTLTLDKLPVEFRPWSSLTETDDLAGADIGISWLPDDGWSAGKCGLKLLQYMAAGLPVVANPVGMQQTLVRDGENGFLARTPEEWVRAISTLAQDASRRRAMGAVGRRRVETEFDVAHGGQAWKEVIASLNADSFPDSLRSPRPLRFN